MLCPRWFGSLSEISHSDSGEDQSRRARIFQLLNKNPSLTPKEICTFMGLDYKLYVKQVTQRKYEWAKAPQRTLRHYRIGVSSNSSKPDGQHHMPTPETSKPHQWQTIINKRIIRLSSSLNKLIFMPRGAAPLVGLGGLVRKTEFLIQDIIQEIEEREWREISILNWKELYF